MEWRFVNSGGWAYISLRGYSGKGEVVMDINLSDPEKELLTDILERELEDVRSEFHHTQAFDYRERLKERESRVRGLLTKLAS